METNKRILIAYYSLSGHTAKVAEQLASLLGADLDRIVDHTKRGGIIHFMSAGRDALKARDTEIAVERDPAVYDLVVVGTPVWAGTITPAARAYVKQYGAQISALACFTTAGSAGPEVSVTAIEEVAGKAVQAALGIVQREWKDEPALRTRLAEWAATLR
jgi:flavodoxin